MTTITRGLGRALPLLVLLAASSLAGCRTTEKELQRWASTQHGPEKLVAVLVHDKYDADLRGQAALALVGMKLRGGRRLGIDLLLDAYPRLSDEERRELNTRLVPALIVELRKPPPAPQSEGNPVQDESIAFKDAAAALLTENAALIPDQGQRDELSNALSDWAFVAFDTRVDASGQRIDMQRMLELLGPRSVKRFPDLLQTEALKLGRAVQIIDKVADKATRAAAGRRLIAIANEVSSARWLQNKRKLVEDANLKAGAKVSGPRLELQLKRFQEEELSRIFGLMKRVHSPEVVGYLVAHAASNNHAVKTRQAALIALDGLVAHADKGIAAPLLTLAKDPATDSEIRALALRRAGERPRSELAAPLFEFFDSKDWRIRQAAAELLLVLGKQEDLEAFMAHIPSVKNLTISEPLRYGRLIGQLKGKSHFRDLVAPYLSGRHSVPERLSALGAYYAHGTPADLAALERWEGDPTPAPACQRDAEGCSWECSGESVKSVGAFVKWCVRPEIDRRAQLEKAQAVAAPKTNAKKPAGPAANASPPGEKTQ